MSDPTETQITQLEKVIAALESQRAILGDSAVDTARVSLQQQITLLQAQLAVAPIPTPTEERRLITILFSDVVGSTTIAERLDPEEWHQVITRVHARLSEIITRHGGMVAQYLGDGLLALFGLPVASESDPENAIRAALEIQGSRNLDLDLKNLGSRDGNQPRGELPATDATTPTRRSPLPNPVLQLRIGIHTGLVITGEIGGDIHREFTAIGDPINLAARLQSAAPPGGILISHDTFNQVRGLFELEPQSPLTIKDKTENVQTYLVHSVRPHPFQNVSRGVTGIQTHTVGREDEFKALQNAYLDAYENRGVVWTQIIGELGIGKSRLLEDLSAWLESRRERLLIFRGRSFPGETIHPYTMVRRLWFDYLQIPEDTPRDLAEVKWIDQFRVMSGIQDPETAYVVGLLLGLSFQGHPHINPILGDPLQIKGRANAISRDLLGQMREQATVVILLEDVHWTDASSWEWLVQVLLNSSQVSRPHKHGLFVLATGRPDMDVPAELVRHAPRSSSADNDLAKRPPAPHDPLRYVPIALAPLADTPARELARNLVASIDGITNEVIEMLVERSEGVPYFAEEMVNWFIDHNIVDTTFTPWRFMPDRLSESPLPSSLQHLLLTRLWALSDVERLVLQHGAVFGRHFWSGGVEALGTPESNSILGQLQPRGMIHVEPVSSFAGDTEWSFPHTLLRDVAYESILKRERPHLHLAAAQWLAGQAQQSGLVNDFAGSIAEHYERAGEWISAVDWYLQAGDQARASSALAEARRLYDRAYKLVPADERERRARTLLGRITIADMQGNMPAQQADIQALLLIAEVIDDDGWRAQARYRQCMHAWKTGNYPGVIVAGDMAIAAAERAGRVDIKVQAMAYRASAQALMGQGDA
ncbi:MAG: adenylate/guanylate cyclase domain-containing protein [Anaerolineae bacterium]